MSDAKKVQKSPLQVRLTDANLAAIDSMIDGRYRRNRTEVLNELVAEALAARARQTAQAS